MRVTKKLLLALTGLLAACASDPWVETQPYDPGAVTADGFRTLELADGAWIAYRRIGEGPPLFVAGGSLLGPDLESLAETHELILFDAVGQGRSSQIEDLDRVELRRDVLDLDALREHLGIERFSMLAWSYQAAVAARYALEFRDRIERLVLIGPLPLRRDPFWTRFGANVVRRLDDEGTARVASLREEGVSRSDPRRFCEEFVRVFFAAYVADPAALEAMRGDPCAAPNNEPDFSSQVSALRLEKLGPWDWRGLVARLEAPTLLVHGEENPVPLEATEEWAAVLPAAELLTLPDCGHMPWLERPVEFFAAVRGFLE